MNLITAREVAQVLQLSKWGYIGIGIAWCFMRITKLSGINRVYRKTKHLDTSSFLEALLLHYNIKFEYDAEELKRIPATGPFISISNHPLGGIDGILLMKLVLDRRSDYKIIANFLLQRIRPLRSYIMAVNPFEQHRDAKSSVIGFKQALLHLKEGKPLGVFPAGEVSTYKEDRLLVDKPWEEAVIKLIRRAEVPVIPIYFHARNSRFFYRLSKISPLLRTAKLPSELYSQKRRPIIVLIGAPISVATQKEAESLKQYTELLRRKTYLLSNVYQKGRLLDKVPKTLKLPRPQKKIIDAVSKDVLQKEIEQLKAARKMLLEHRHFQVYLAQEAEMPNVLLEIGRQREVTFRAVGEGTNRALDLDVFDSYYHHLFLWDDSEKTIVGAYRMGLGADIYASYGMQGFYLSDLFRFEPELHQMMSQTIEMGRAYIAQAYQQKPMPLFLLWKGIIHTTLLHPNHKYLMGGVSISNQFSNFSKSLMIEFMRSHYWDAFVAQYIRPKKEFKVRLKAEDKEFVFDSTKADLNKFDRLIAEVEPGNLRLPVLIKKYIKQNARVVAFNVDPLFNNAVDGLMYIKVSDIPEETVRPVMEEFQKKVEQLSKELATS